MPFALLIVGLLLIVTGANDSYKDFGKLIVGDFTGDKNFLYWLLAFGSLGALGYNETLRPFARAFMLLIFIALIIRNGGFFDKLNEALQSTQRPPADTTTASASVGLSGAQEALDTGATVLKGAFEVAKFAVMVA